MSEPILSRADAIDLLTGLVAIPSLSRQEQEAATWLAADMARLGFDRAYVDAAGNAVGEIGSSTAKQTLVLLGHIDTVPGAIPVRVERRAGQELLFGRGAVDAKGPLATFVCAAARVAPLWAAFPDLRIVVVGAVEEEAATSKGARFIRERFSGQGEPIPAACIIGEPSSWGRVTLGYKGRILVDMTARQPMAHTAGPDAGVATVAVDFWNAMTAYVIDFNRGRAKSFDQLLPSLRGLTTTVDNELNDVVTAQAGIRLPLDFAVDGLVAHVAAWAAARSGATDMDVPSAMPADQGELSLCFPGETTTIELSFRGHEQAWRSDRNNLLVRSFLSAIRTVDPAQRPGFVVKTGTSDMNVVGPAWQCPILAYGPGDSTLDHTPHEHIRLDEYWRAVLVLEQALHHLAQALTNGD